MSSSTTPSNLQSDTVLMTTYYQKSGGLYNHAYGGSNAELIPTAFHSISPYGLDASATSYSHTHQTHPVVHTQPHYTTALQNQVNWPQLAHRYGQMANTTNTTAHHLAASVVSSDYNNNRLFSHSTNSLLPASAEICGSPSPHRNIRQPTTSTTYQEWLTSTSNQQTITTSAGSLRNSSNSDDRSLRNLDSNSMSSLVSHQDQQVLPTSQKSQNGLRINTLNRYTSPAFHRTLNSSPTPNTHGEYLHQTMNGSEMQTSLTNSPVSFSDISVPHSEMVQTLPQQPILSQQVHHSTLQQPQQQQHSLHNTCYQLNRLNSPVVSNSYLQLPHPAMDRGVSNDDGLCSSDPDSSPNPLMNGSRAPYDWMRSAQMESTSKIRKAGKEI